MTSEACVDIESSHEGDAVTDGLERMYLGQREHLLFFRGTREQFAAHFSKVLCAFKPDLVTRFPNVNFLGGVAVVTYRNHTPYLWVALPNGRHLDVTMLIREHGTQEEQENIHRVKKGFITNNGRFVSRIAAREVAHNAGQLLPSAGKQIELFSDDVW
jgi:hypothetical protein